MQALNIITLILPMLVAGDGTTKPQDLQNGKLDFLAPNIPLNETEIQEMPNFGWSIDDYLTHINNLEKLSPKLLAEKDQKIIIPGADIEPKFLAPIAGISYCPDNKLKNWSCIGCKSAGNKLKLYKIMYNKKKESRVVILLSEVNREVIVSIWGTTKPSNWLTNLNFIRTKLHVLSGASVHLGFKNYADSLQPDINKELAILISNEKYKDFNIKITGHSLGGVAATLVAVYTQQELKLPWNRMSVVTFGQPRVGNKKFATWYDSPPLNYTRAVDENDLVPHVPPRKLLGYYHVKDEMYVHNGKSYSCPSSGLENNICSNSLAPFLSIDAHLRVWGTILGEAGCWFWAFFGFFYKKNFLSPLQINNIFPSVALFYM